MGKVEVNCLPESTQRVYESGLGGQKKIHRSVSCRSKSQRPILPIRKSGELAKTDHVKTSPQRQVKVRSFHFCFSSGVFFLLFSSQQMNAAAAVDLIFVNGNIYTVDEKRPHAE